MMSSMGTALAMCIVLAVGAAGSDTVIRGFDGKPDVMGPGMGVYWYYENLYKYAVARGEVPPLD
jgi:hypothetical protein